MLFGLSVEATSRRKARLMDVQPRTCRDLEGEIHVVELLGVSSFVKTRDAFEVLHPIVGIFVYSSAEGFRFSW